MITTAIYYFFYLFGVGIVAILPPSPGFVTAEESAVLTILQTMKPFGFIIPFTTVFAVLTASFLFWVSLGVFVAINWLVRKFPGVN